jgi:hypothetical protein
MAFAIAGLSTAATIGLVSAGVGAATAGGMAIGANQRRKSRERELDQFAKQSPLYTPSKSIQEYYQQALNRYNENPYQSQQYQLGAMNAQRATAQGIGALQDRRSAIGGIGRLALGQNTAMQNLGAQAEAQRNQRFGQLGGASQMQAAEQAKAFDINKMTPYNRQFGLKQMKSAAANEEYAKNVSSTFNALGNMASIGMMSGQTAGVPPTGMSAGNLAKNDATLNNFYATRGKINPNYIPNARGVYPQNSTFLNDMSNWNKARSLGG